MKKRLGAVLLMAVILTMAGCGNSNSGEESVAPDIQMTENTDQADVEENISTEGVADYPAAFMANDTIYLVGEVPMSAEVDDSAIIGYTESFTDTFPENNGETNFNPELGMPYAQVEGGIAILYQNEWYLGTPFSNAEGENTITFDGVIIDHTLESIAPVICVKTLEEEVIPYETVFFELPDDEADWALQTGVVVTIICDGAFTEQAPYFGTLISITGLTTEADNSINAPDQEDEKKQALDDDVLSPIDGVTMEVLECSETSVTIKLTNDTDKDINCGTDFHLNILDEKTGEWRYLDTVIDDAAFDAIAIMIQKDSPYETVIDFEWLYGKLKPGRYQIVKTVMDFRGTGDYTNYVYAAVFDI